MAARYRCRCRSAPAERWSVGAHDRSVACKSDGIELATARRRAGTTANAKSDAIGRVSHDIRTPLNAIIGFADVMIGEQFGPVGNPRYLEYLKDIRASGERVAGLIDDMGNLSRAETGKIDLSLYGRRAQ